MKKKSVSVQIDFDVWLRFKILCAKQDRTISDMVAEILTKVVEEGGEEGGEEA